MSSDVDFSPRRHRPAFSLLELLAVIGILGLLASLVLVNFRPISSAAKKDACYVTKGEIEVQASLWRRNYGSWPQANLADIGANTSYFPEGLPVCPVDGSAYTLDPSTHRVAGHTH
jgi:prepilin-type N-terminal cleavage/methylation domain-containing protein